MPTAKEQQAAAKAATLATEDLHVADLYWSHHARGAAQKRWHVAVIAELRKRGEVVR